VLVAQPGAAADRRWSRTQPGGDRRSPAAPTVAGRGTTLRGIEDERPQGRERLLDAAVALIARDGVDNLRIARIATEAGVSPGLVHYHFASRDALLEEAIEHSYERAGNQRLGATTGEGRSVAARLGAMIDQCLPGDRELRDDWVLWVELWLRSARHPALRPTAARLYSRLHAWFAEAIAEGVSSGEIAECDVHRVTDRLLALIDGYGIRVLAGDPEMDLARARAEIWSALAGDLGLQGG